MASFQVNDQGIAAAASFGSLLQELMAEAAAIKPVVAGRDPSSSLEPPLSKQDFDGISDRVANATSDMIPEGIDDEDEAAKTQAKSRKFALIEAVTRDIFSNLTATTAIDSPEFAILWNFLDIIYIIADDGHCEPALLFWLIEELLESQTIPGCRTIFDYLESRRERITAKHTKSTDLVILRSCNELLRRLSRAEDTAFCGRVFIFLFQSFPLGDRSSVNLRGEYHVENVTTYEKPEEEDKASQMEVDTDKNTAADKKTSDAKTHKADEPLSSDQLYDLFWPLQESFSQPLTLFEKSTFKKFQHGVEETVKKFKQYPSDEGARATNALEDPKQSLKRKREGNERSEAFNPKYLTSKDLFELEIGDLTFRRHVLVQTLIVLNFVLSWTGEAKKKYEKINVTNKSVIYPGEFSEEDAKWALTIKSRIADYLRKDTPGKIFHRMVDTVLARDKNWVYWKMASCEPIQRDPVKPEEWAESQAAMQRATTNKRLRPVPLNAVPMEFLEDKDRAKVVEELKNPERYRVPDLDSFKVKISDDDFEISMAKSDGERAQAVALKASKTWRAMRIARGIKLAAFDKIDDDANDVSAIFEPLVDIDAAAEAAAEGGDDAVAPDDKMPTNRETIIIASTPEASATTVPSPLVSHLQDSHKGVFGRVVRHTTRDPADGEVPDQTYHFVKAQEFNQLRDGDRLVEYTEGDDVAYGTSSKAIDTVTESGKVAVIEMSIDAAKFAKDMMDFQARYVLVQPAGAEPPTGEDADVFGHVVSLGEDVAEAGKALASYIFDKGDGAQEDKPEGDASDKAAEQSTEPATNGDAPQPQQDMEVDGGA